MRWQMHTVLNQPASSNNSSLLLSDTTLYEAVTREGTGQDGDLLAGIGQQLKTTEPLELGRLTNNNPPELLRYDATDARLDDARFHSAQHLLMQGLCADRVHDLAWRKDVRESVFVARAAHFLLHTQVEVGTLCPITMIFAATPPLQHALPTPFRDRLSSLLNDCYDLHLAPDGQKRGLLVGIGTTEKQGGSDVSSNVTRMGKTVKGFYRLTGHKWFFSMSQSDAHPVPVRAPAGLSYFFVPRLLSDGQCNGVHPERLKERPNNRPNANSEVESYDACGWLVGGEGDGVWQTLRMGGLICFDCALGSHALIYRAFSVALYHVLQRQTSGKDLADQPMMRQPLGQVALRLKGQTTFLFRLVRVWDCRNDAQENAWARLFAPAVKFAICKTGILFVTEAMEVFGGVDYREKSEPPRLYHEVPVDSIWEGSSNIMCLDAIRVFNKQLAAMELLTAECAEVKGQNRHPDCAWRQLQQLLKRPTEEQGKEIARLVYHLGVGAQMLRHVSPPLTKAWYRMILDTRGGMCLGAPTLGDLLL